MKRLIFAFLLIASPAAAYDGAGWDTGSVAIGGAISPGAVTLTETLGPELVTLDATCTGWSLAAGWSCSSGTIVHTAGGGSGAATYTISGGTIVGTTYKVTHTTSAVSGSTYQTGIGGVLASQRGSAGTYTEYFVAGTTGVLQFGVYNTALATTVTAISVKAVTSVISPSAGPVKIEKTMANATANESALVVSGNQTGAGGDKTVLELDYVGTAGSGSEYLINAKNAGTSTFSVTAAGAGAFASDLNAGSTSSTSSGTFIGQHTSAGVNGIFKSSAVMANAAGTVFNYYGKPAIHSAGTDLEAFRSIPDLSNNHTGGNWISFSAPDLVAPDADIVKYVTKGGTGYNYAEYYAAGLETHAPQAVSCTDGVGVSALTITPTAEYVEVTNLDADGCDITMGETGMVAGTKVTICVVSNAGTTVNFADTAGVSELAGAFNANIDDCITLRYGNTTTWREVSRSAN